MFCNIMNQHSAKRKVWKSPVGAGSAEEAIPGLKLLLQGWWEAAALNPGSPLSPDCPALRRAPRPRRAATGGLMPVPAEESRT